MTKTDFPKNNGKKLVTTNFMPAKVKKLSKKSLLLSGGLMLITLLPLSFSHAQVNKNRFILKQDLGYIYNFSNDWSKKVISGSAISGNFTSTSDHTVGFGAAFNWTHPTGFGVSADYLGFRHSWTGKGAAGVSTADYTSNYHVVTVTPSYRLAMDAEGYWGFRIGFGVGFSVSDLNYNISNAIGYNTGGYTYVAQENLKWTQGTTPNGTITTTTPIGFSDRIENSYWNDLAIPYQFDNATSVVQTQRLKLFDGTITPTIGTTIKPNVPFKTEYTGTLNMDTNYPTGSGFLYLRLTLNTIHFPDNAPAGPGVTNPRIETKRTVFSGAIRQGQFSIPLSGFNSNALLPVNTEPGSNGEFLGSIPMRIELTLEYFDAPTKTPAGGTETSISETNANGTFKLGTAAITGNTQSDLNLYSAAVTFSQINQAGNLVNNDVVSHTDNDVGFIIAPQMGFEYDNGFLHFDLSTRYMHSLLDIEHAASEASTANNGVVKATYTQKAGPLALFVGTGIGISF